MHICTLHNRVGRYCFKSKFDWVSHGHFKTKTIFWWTPPCWTAGRIDRTKWLGTKCIRPPLLSVLYDLFWNAKRQEGDTKAECFRIGGRVPDTCPYLSIVQSVYNLCTVDKTMERMAGYIHTFTGIYNY